jgi:lactoylglutathione lyase
METLDLNHVALHVRDLEASVEFYSARLGLAPIPRPDFDFPGAWFRLGESQELHLIAGRDGDVRSHRRGSHFALGVASIAEAEAELTAQGLSFEGRFVRPDGAYQIYVYDPDGYAIEFCQVDVGVGDS